MAQYKLIVVEDDGREIYSIGTFADEGRLEQWARENIGELAAAEQEETEKHRVE